MAVLTRRRMTAEDLEKFDKYFAAYPHPNAALFGLRVEAHVMVRILAKHVFPLVHTRI